MTVAVAVAVVLAMTMTMTVTVTVTVTVTETVTVNNALRDTSIHSYFSFIVILHRGQVAQLAGNQRGIWGTAWCPRKVQ